MTMICLFELRFTWKQIGDEKVGYLCESLKFNHHTTTLNLNGGTFQWVGSDPKPVKPSFGEVGARHIGEMLEMNSSLTTLILHSYPLFHDLLIVVFAFS